MYLKDSYSKNLIQEGFSEKAILEIEKACDEYRNDIINESKRLEKEDRGPNSEPEIIAKHIITAKDNYRKSQKKSLGVKIVNIMLDLFMLILGGFFDKEQLLKNDIYLGFYMLLLLITIILVVVKYSKEG